MTIVDSSQEKRRLKNTEYVLKCLPNFSRRFMKWNANITVTFCLIHTNWPNSSTKFYENLWRQIEPLGLANWTKKILTFFRVKYINTISGETKGFF